MPELEIKKEAEYAEDQLARNVGIIAAIIATILAVVTISSHRAHTDAVLAKAEASDQWAFYQAKSLKRNNASLGADLSRLSAADPAKAAAIIEHFRKEAERYEAEAKPIEQKAEQFERDCERHERRALRFDMGEGLLELGLVLCSLYFISKRKLFPAIGTLTSTVGFVIAVSGLLV